MLRPTAVQVKALDDFMLSVTFDNGEQKKFDVKPYISGNFYGKLADKSYFASVKTNGFSVEWADGQDICPDDLYYLGQ